MLYQHFDRAECLIYSMGWKARQDGAPKSPPGNLGWGQRHYWLAGYSDAEIAIEGPATPAKGTYCEQTASRLCGTRAVRQAPRQLAGKPDAGTTGAIGAEQGSAILPQAPLHYRPRS